MRRRGGQVSRWAVVVLAVGLAAPWAASAQGLDVHATSPDEFAIYLKSEVAKWTRVIRVAGLHAN